MVDVYKPLFILLLVCVICGVQSACILSLEKDFGSPSPVLLKDGNFLTSNTDNGDILIQRSDTILVACPGSKKRIMLGNTVTSYDILEAHCIINSTFRVDRQIVQFKDIRCNGQPFFSTEQQPGTCAGNGKLHGVGYKIKNVFYKLYSACFDENVLHTHYVEHRLTPMTKYKQNEVKRPTFIEGSLFGSVRMSEAYKKANQKSRLDAILGSNMGDKYVSKEQYLSRGHLAARADYSTSAEMRATFHYVNTAPQWYKGNAGDWGALEEALRRRVQARGSDVIVYTGSHGIMSLPDNRGHMKELYLHVDSNNNPVVPVPMYYFKVVYDPKKKTAVTFISINSSFYNNTLTDKLEFCDDVCAGNKNFYWLSWRVNDGTHSFCCDYKQFVKKIDYLPKMDVRGQFY